MDFGYGQKWQEQLANRNGLLPPNQYRVDRAYEDLKAGALEDLGGRMVEAVEVYVVQGLQESFCGQDKDTFEEAPAYNPGNWGDWEPNPWNEWESRARNWAWDCWNAELESWQVKMEEYEGKELPEFWKDIDGLLDQWYEACEHCEQVSLALCTVCVDEQDRWGHWKSKRDKRLCPTCKDQYLATTAESKELVRKMQVWVHFPAHTSQYEGLSRPAEDKRGIVLGFSDTQVEVKVGRWVGLVTRDRISTASRPKFVETEKV